MATGSTLLTYVFPAVGCVLSLLMFSSSFAAVLRVRSRKRLGELNPIPYAGILGLTTGQVIYGSVISNWFVFWANAPGLLIGLWLTFSTLPHAIPKVQNVMTACVMVVAAYFSTIAVVTSHLQANQETKAKIWGSAGALALISYYTAPLSSLIKVIKKKDSSSLHPPLCIMNFFNMCLWLNYGIAIKNPFIWAPETIGGVLAVSALVLMLTFPRRETDSIQFVSESVEPAQAEIENVPARSPL